MTHPQVSTFYKSLVPLFSERLRRLFAAMLAQSLCRRGIRTVTEATGVACSTIGKGLRELVPISGGAEPGNHVRWGASAPPRPTNTVGWSPQACCNRRIFWPGFFPETPAGKEPTLAIASLDRLVQNGHRFECSGDSRRRTRAGSSVGSAESRTRRIARDLRSEGFRKPGGGDHFQ